MIPPKENGLSTLVPKIFNSSYVRFTTNADYLAIFDKKPKGKHFTTPSA